MNTGSLYQVSSGFWLLFPTKEIITAVAEYAPCLSPPRRWSAEATVAHYAAWHSKNHNCNVSWFSPDSLLVCLEEDGDYKKLLTSEGLIGWIWFVEGYNQSFIEVKRPSLLQNHPVE